MRNPSPSRGRRALQGPEGVAETETTARPPLRPVTGPPPPRGGRDPYAERPRNLLREAGLLTVIPEGAFCVLADGAAGGRRAGDGVRARRRRRGADQPRELGRRPPRGHPPALRPGSRAAPVDEESLPPRGGGGPSRARRGVAETETTARPPLRPVTGPPPPRGGRDPYAERPPMRSRRRGTHPPARDRATSPARREGPLR